MQTATQRAKREQIQALLDRANGRRRARTCHWDHVCQAVGEAISYGIGGAKGGVVANAYGFPAETTRIATVQRSDGSILIDIGIGNASKNGGYAVHGPSCWNERGLKKCREWADLQHSLTERFVILSRAEARRLLKDRERRTLEAKQEAWGACPVEGSILVTTDDSLAAGNCPTETTRVAAHFTQSTATAESLWSYCVAHESPSLRPFVVRALKQAERHVHISLMA